MLCLVDNPWEAYPFFFFFLKRNGEGMDLGGRGGWGERLEGESSRGVTYERRIKEVLS